jgi:hypothetical protein
MFKRFPIGALDGLDCLVEIELANSCQGFDKWLRKHSTYRFVEPKFPSLHGKVRHHAVRCRNCGPSHHRELGRSQGPRRTQKAICLRVHGILGHGSPQGENRTFEQDRARVVVKQDYGVRYESNKTG